MSYLEERRKHIEGGRPLPPKKKYVIPKKSDKRIIKEKEQGVEIVKARSKGWFDVNKVGIERETISNMETIHANDMTKFWGIAATVISKKPYCWECGDRINKSDFRSATAHIFPKSIFLSIADNEWNYLVLGARCGCHNKTHTLETFSLMSIFPTAVNRFYKFHELITEKHKYLNLFIEYANATI